MAFPIASSLAVGTAASPAYSGVFIPEIWSTKLIQKFYDATVLAQISNTDYQGEIKNQGDKVIIRTKPTITIRDYENGQALTLERPSSNVVELLIDKGKYWNTILDDVMETQMDIKMMSKWAEDAAEQLKIAIDTAVLATLTASVAAANKGATAGRISGNLALGTTTVPVQVTTSNVIDKIIDMGQVLDEQNIPETGRWLIIPAWMASRIKKSDLKDASLTGDGETPLRNGRLGMIDRFTLYKSNLLPSASTGGGGTPASTTRHEIIGGHSHGLTFAAQIAKTETMRSELTFGQIMRGLSVYGSKVVDGTALTTMYAYPG
jgi:hypothetical protein